MLQNETPALTYREGVLLKALPERPTWCVDLAKARQIENVNIFDRGAGFDFGEVPGIGIDRDQDVHSRASAMVLKSRLKKRFLALDGLVRYVPVTSPFSRIPS